MTVVGAAASSSSPVPSSASVASKVVALQKQIQALQKQLKEVQASAASASGKQAELDKQQAQLLATQIQALQQQVTQLSESAKAPRARQADDTATRTDRRRDAKSGDGLDKRAGDDGRARLAAAGEALGTVLDAWA